MIQQSESWGNPPVVVHPRIDAALREQLKRIFLAIHESDEGRKVLAPLMIDQFILPDDQGYDPVRQMAEEARGHIGRSSGLAPGADLDEDGVDVQTEAKSR